MNSIFFIFFLGRPDKRTLQKILEMKAGNLVWTPLQHVLDHKILFTKVCTLMQLLKFKSESNKNNKVSNLDFHLHSSEIAINNNLHFFTLVFILSNLS